jgi:hypothetical protein
MERTEPSARGVGDGAGPSYDFSPDGTLVIGAYPAEGVVRTLPVDGSEGST